MTKLIIYFDSLNKILDKKERREIIKTYNDWVIYQPSIVDGNYNVSKPHHFRNVYNLCGQKKPHDLWQVPITHIQHINETKYRKLFEERIPELHERFLADNLDLKEKVNKHVDNPHSIVNKD